MSFFSEHKTALSGAATLALGVLASVDQAALAAISPKAGAYATVAMGAVTSAIGLYNTYKKLQAQAALIPPPAR